MKELKQELLDILERKNELIEDFKTATLSCVTNIEDIKDDIDKADKYMEFVQIRQLCTDEITDIIEFVKNDEKLVQIFESDDEDIKNLRAIYNNKYEDIKELQPKMNEIGEAIMVEMRGEFKKIKQSQNFNNVYFNSPYTSGTKFDAKQ